MIYTCPTCHLTQETKEMLQKITVKGIDLIQIRECCSHCQRWVRFIKYEHSYLVKAILLDAYKNEQKEIYNSMKQSR